MQVGGVLVDEDENDVRGDQTRMMRALLSKPNADQVGRLSCCLAALTDDRISCHYLGPSPSIFMMTLRNSNGEQVCRLSCNVLW